MIEYVVAVHALGVGDPECEWFHTGKWNEDGSPEVKRTQVTIQPGTLFPVTRLQGGATEAQELIDLGAARLPEPQELAMLAMQQGAKR